MKAVRNSCVDTNHVHKKLVVHRVLFFNATIKKSWKQSPAEHILSRTNNPVIGLDVAGTLHFCRKSTLLGVESNSSTYFDARFGPERMLDLLDPGMEYVDGNGREIYFIDRNPTLFKHVLGYIRTKELPIEIGSFVENPKLWRALQKEADYFLLDGLSSAFESNI